MAKFIKASIALCIAVIFFGGIYLVSKDSSGQSNIVKIIMNTSQKVMAAKMEKMQQSKTKNPEGYFEEFDQNDMTINFPPPANVQFDEATRRRAQELAQDPKKMQQALEALQKLTKDNPELAESLKRHQELMQKQQALMEEDFSTESAPQSLGEDLQADIPPAYTASVPAIAPKADINKTIEEMNSYELTASLMVAVSKNDLAKAKQLLSNGADPNTAENATSATPLFTAISNNNPQMVQLLLDHGANVTQVNEKGSLPIHEAASGNAFGKDKKYRANEIIQSLIEHGADVNQKNAKGQTPLMLACKSARKETVLFLLNKNAKTDIQDAKGKTVGDYASEVPAPDCFQILRQFTKESI